MVASPPISFTGSWVKKVGSLSGEHTGITQNAVIDSMDAETLIQIRNVDDLKKILHMQKTITSRAKNELLAVASDSALEPEGDIEEQADYFMEEESKLLEKYAKYPTLTEFQLMPHLYDATKWGATFGVTLLVGELIFEQLKICHPDFAPVIRPLFILLLSELENPQHAYLIEPLEKHLRFKITTEEGGNVSEEEKRRYVRDLVNQFVETTVNLAEGYGILDVKTGGVAINELGKRVLLHLVDASKFVEEMTKA